MNIYDVAIIGSYGWGGKTLEILAGMIPNFMVEVIDQVLRKDLPLKRDLEALDNLAPAISKKHKEHNFT